MDTLQENQELGKRIAKIRTSQKITLRELANKVNLSPSLLSQIEKGRINPSLTTLRMIAAALDVPVFSLFLEEVAPNSLVVRAGTGRKIVFPEANLEYTLLTPDLNGSIEMAMLKLAPKSLSCANGYAHTGEEVAYVAAGRATLYLGDKTELLNTGDSIRIPPGVQHKWENTADEEAIIIFAVSPPTF